MKRYSYEELLDMPEERLNMLAENDEIDDDDWMYWHQIHEEAAILMEDFIKYELPFYMEKGEL